MLQSDTESEFRKFLKDLQNLEMIYLVLPGAVILGGYSLRSEEDKTISLTNSITYTGGSEIETQDLTIPVEKILAWGFKED